jgi:hypothetical protein
VAEEVEREVEEELHLEAHLVEVHQEVLPLAKVADLLLVAVHQVVVREPQDHPTEVVHRLQALAHPDHTAEATTMVVEPVYHIQLVDAHQVVFSPSVSSV